MKNSSRGDLIIILPLYLDYVVEDLKKGLIQTAQEKIEKLRDTLLEVRNKENEKTS